MHHTKAISAHTSQKTPIAGHSHYMSYFILLNYLERPPTPPSDSAAKVIFESLSFGFT